MNRIRRAAARPLLAGAAAIALLRDTASVFGRLVAAVFVPESSEEAVIEFGLLLLAAGFLVRGNPDLALLVPGAILIAVSLGFNLRRAR